MKLVHVQDRHKPYSRHLVISINEALVTTKCISRPESESWYFYRLPHRLRPHPPADSGSKPQTLGDSDSAPSIYSIHSSTPCVSDFWSQGFISTMIMASSKKIDLFKSKNTYLHLGPIEI